MMNSVRLHMKSFWLVPDRQGILCYHEMFSLKESLFLLKNLLKDCQCLLRMTFLFDFHLIIRGLIVPSKEKKKDKKSSLMRKLGRSSKSGSVVSQSQNAPGLVGLLETMRVQMEV